MLIKAHDGIEFDIEDTLGGCIVQTDSTHFTIEYTIDDGWGTTIAVATYTTKEYAIKALKELEETGKLLSDGCTTLVKEDEIMRKMVMDYYSLKDKQPNEKVNIIDINEENKSADGTIAVYVILGVFALIFMMIIPCAFC